MTRLSKHELDELQSPDAWEDSGEIVQPSSKPARAVVSVALPREDYEAVVESAKRLGMKTSEFMRRAAVEMARPTSRKARVLSVSGRVQTAYIVVSPPRPRIDVTTRTEHTESLISSTT